jgi:hypothetical protein
MSNRSATGLKCWFLRWRWWCGRRRWWDGRLPSANQKERAHQHYENDNYDDDNRQHVEPASFPDCEMDLSGPLIIENPKREGVIAWSRPLVIQRREILSVVKQAEGAVEDCKAYTASVR